MDPLLSAVSVVSTKLSFGNTVTASSERYRLHWCLLLLCQSVWLEYVAAAVSTSAPGANTQE